MVARGHARVIDEHVSAFSEAKLTNGMVQALFLHPYDGCLKKQIRKMSKRLWLATTRRTARVGFSCPLTEHSASQQVNLDHHLGG